MEPVWTVSQVTRSNAGGQLFNAVRIADGVECDREPTHSESIAQQRAFQLNQRDAKAAPAARFLPWTVSVHTDGRIVAIYDAKGRCVMTGDQNLIGRIDEFRYIVACVNACAGIEADGLAELPGGTVSGLLDLVSTAPAQMREMRKQRDALADAVRQIVKAARVNVCGVEQPLLAAIETGATLMQAINDAAATLAKVKS